jgi:hypothetical protein
VRTEEADSYEAKLLAGRKRYWAQMALIFTSAIVLAFGALKASRSRPTGAEKARRQEALRVQDARATVSEAREQLARAQASFDEAIHEAIADRIGPSLPLVAGPIAIGDAEKLVRGRSMLPLLVVHDAEAHYWSPSVERARQDVSTAEALLDGVNPMSAVVYADALDANPIDQRLTRDVVVVASHWKRPTRASVTAFEPGELDGTAYVFDFATRRVVCAGEIHAGSSKSLEYTYNETSDARGLRLDQRLEEDLDRQIARAVAEPNALFLIH